jgi:shikimate 5-dehydrogenase
VTAGITGATRVYLHLAHPSAHARTPQVMNAEFARRGVDAVAVSADVAPADLGGFARGLRGWRNLAGLSVTMPHKESLATHVDELIGAVNVVRRESDGRLVAGPPDPAGHDMRPGDPLPVAVSRLAPGTLVCDIVTRPEQTRLLDEAAARRCVPHPGLPMLASQVDLILDFLGLSGTGQSMIVNDIFCR